MRKRTIILSFVMFHLNVVAQTDLTNGLLFYMSFNTEIVDETGNGIIEKNGEVRLIDCEYSSTSSKVVRLSGVKSFLELRNSYNYNPSDNYSISLWLSIPNDQVTLTSTVNAIISKWILSNGDHDKQGYPFALRVFNQTSENNGRMIFTEFDGLDVRCKNVSRIITENTYNDGLFHHVVIGKKNNKLKLYIDCQLIGELESQADCSTSNSANILIGSRNETYAFHRPNNFKGKIDEVRIYNRFLSEEELELICNKNYRQDPEIPTTNNCDFNILYPNPFCNTISSRMEFENITIYDIKGSLIASKVRSLSYLIELPPSVYLIKLGECKTLYKVVKICH